ncbi:MAG: sporulation integral membrane protein YlbJ [Defluviitaleaceae bacterium]|nr:sporulation integral membrane protein YlbJ [Defluviitaleaceae bacterium]
MKKNFSSNINIIIPIIVAIFNVFLILNPSEMINAAKDGLQLWFNQVLPTLLPFVVGANLLAGLGFIHFIGALTAPIMIPVFKVPGVGAFALLTGFTSGYPMGAKAVAHLWETQQIQQQEAQRLLAFSNNAGPLFVVGFVGAGLFNSVRLGYMLLISHIIAALIIGLVLRFFSQEYSVHHQKQFGGLKQAFYAYQEFRNTDYKGLGHILGTSVKNAMEAMLLIGGFIITFCVVIKALEISGIFTVLNYFSSNDKVYLATGFVAGLLEVANGAKMISQGSEPTAMTLAATTALISFGGFSIHGQTAHFIRNTDIQFAPYLAAKCLHAMIAGGICLLITSYFAIPATTLPTTTLEMNFISRISTAGYHFIVLTGLMMVMAFCFSFMLSYRKN